MINFPQFICIVFLKYIHKWYWFRLKAVSKVFPFSLAKSNRSVQS